MGDDKRKTKAFPRPAGGQVLGNLQGKDEVQKGQHETRGCHFWQRGIKQRAGDGTDLLYGRKAQGKATFAGIEPFGSERHKSCQEKRYGYNLTDFLLVF